MLKPENDRGADGECESEYLDKVNLLKLVEIANINGKCVKTAALVFQRKFASKLIIFMVGDSNSMTGDDINNDNIERIFDSQLAINTINQFGHLISKLSLHFSYNGYGVCPDDELKQNRQLFNSINKYCRNSLTQIVIQYSGCYNEIFNELIGPFDKVKSVAINLFSAHVINDTHRLGETFPNVEHLNLDFGQFTNANIFNSAFPKLHELGIATGFFYEMNEPVFAEMLQKNPQISYLSLVQPTHKSLENINKYLPNLEELHIVMQNVSNSHEIFFSSVQRLNLWLPDGKCYPPEKITFGKNLTEIALVCSAPDIGNDYLNFLFKYPLIRKLNAGVALKNAHLSQMIGKFTNLSEAFFDFGSDVNAGTVSQFVEQSKQLNKLIFYHVSVKNGNEFKEQLEKNVGKDFNVQFSQIGDIEKKFFIERKNPIGNDVNNNSLRIACNKMAVLITMCIVMAHAHLF